MHLSLTNESSVTEKKLDEIEQFLKNTDTVVLIHASWCHHCIHFMPTWKKCKKTFKEQNINTIQVEYDALGKVTQNKFIAKKLHNKDGMYFPMIIYFVSTGTKTAKKMYEGDRSKEDVVGFVNKHKTKAAKKQGGGANAKKANKDVEEEVNKILNQYFKL